MEILAEFYTRSYNKLALHLYQKPALQRQIFLVIHFLRFLSTVISALENHVTINNGLYNSEKNLSDQKIEAHINQ